MRLQVIFAIILVQVAFMVPVDVTQRVLLVSSVMLALMVEMISSGIGATVGRISLNIHSLANKAKDLDGAVVSLALINAILTWIMILWPLG